MLALLVDALNVYQRGALSPVGSVRRLYVDAERWIMQGRAHPEALSFETVCEALGINPTLLRRRVLEWKHEARARSMAANARLTVMPRQYHSNHRRGRPRLSQSA
ncbi:MAG TPA: hypothetical protein VFB15_04640 [Candidatus Binataceae bacterium]|nr:hypothetical protein [Candidatus Binataceae bacterium]